MKHIIFFSSSFVCAFVLTCLLFLLGLGINGCENRLLRNNVRILKEQQTRNLLKKKLDEITTKDNG